MSPMPNRSWPLTLTAWCLMVQGALSLAGTLLSLIRHQLSVDVTIGSLLLGIGLLVRNRAARWLALASLGLQVAMGVWVFYAMEGDFLGRGRLFSYLCFEAGAGRVKGLMAGVLALLALQAVYLALPGTGRLFRRT